MTYNDDDIIDAEIISETTEEQVLEEPSDYWKLVAFHLSSNHNPPIPISMTDVCIRAIEYANEGDWKTQIMLPEGTTYKGSTHATVETIVESHHLHQFITSDREVVTIKDADGAVIYQGYGTELKLETNETNEEVEVSESNE